MTINCPANRDHKLELTKKLWNSNEVRSLLVPRLLLRSEDETESEFESGLGSGLWASYILGWNWPGIGIEESGLCFCAAPEAWNEARSCARAQINTHWQPPQGSPGGGHFYRATIAPPSSNAQFSILGSCSLHGKLCNLFTFCIKIVHWKCINVESRHKGNAGSAMDLHWKNYYG